MHRERELTPEFCNSLNMSKHFLGKQDNPDKAATIDSGSGNEKTRKEPDEVEKQYSHFLEITEEAIISINESNNIVFFNRGAEKVFGHRKTDVIGQSLNNLLPENIHTSHHGMIEGFSKAPADSRQMETRNQLLGRRKSGELFAAEASISKAHIRGEIVYTAFLRDVSEKEKAKAALQESEARFRNLVETSQDLIWNLDEYACFSYVNPAWKSTLGFSQDEMLGRPITDFEKPGITSALLFHWDGNTQCSTISNFEATLVKKTGEDVILKFRAKCVTDSKGNLLHILGTAYNITSKRRLEAKLARSEKLKSLGKIASSVAHDLNNLLTPMLGYAELLASRLAVGTLERKYSGLIVKNASWAKELTTQILLSSRDKKVENEVVDISTLIQEVIEHIRPTLPNLITIIPSVPSMPLQALCNRVRVRQLLLNLISNAIHAISERGKIEVMLEKQCLNDHECYSGESISGDYLRIAVIDNGIGMDIKTLHEMFEPFFTTREADEGTGLGLATVYSIVQECKGNISVATQIGEGTTFEIFLPRTIGAAEADTEESEQTIANHAERILVVDDRQDILALWRSYFESLGYRVTTASDGSQALDMITSKPTGFDLVLTDLSMPVMAGDVLAQRLQDLNIDIPLLLCTGFCGDLDEENCHEIGVTRLLHKPVKLSLLGKVVGDVFRETA